MFLDRFLASNFPESNISSRDPAIPLVEPLVRNLGTKSGFLSRHSKLAVLHRKAKKQHGGRKGEFIRSKDFKRIILRKCKVIVICCL